MRRRPPAELAEAVACQEPPRGFVRAITAGRGVRVIAEIKRRSPSAGLIISDPDVRQTARTYERSGAAALSVLTDATYFGGSLEDLSAARGEVEIPVLRKEFVIDAYQVHEARAAGADAVLLIAEAIGVGRVVDLLSVSRDLGMDTLLEVHEASNLRQVLDAVGPSGEDFVIGINSRDLRRQVTDLSIVEQLAEMLPAGTPFVAESGIRDRRDVERVVASGAAAVLVGESLLRSGDPGKALAALLGRGT